MPLVAIKKKKVKTAGKSNFEYLLSIDEIPVIASKDEEYIRRLSIQTDAHTKGCVCLFAGIHRTPEALIDAICSQETQFFEARLEKEETPSGKDVWYIFEGKKLNNHVAFKFILLSPSHADSIAKRIASRGKDRHIKISL